MNFIFKKNKIINKCEKNILNIEFNFESAKKFNSNSLDKFYQQFNNYVLVCKILLSEPQFYSTLKFILLDQSINCYEHSYQEIIWIHEHYNFIEELRFIENDIGELLLFAYDFGWISKIQYLLCKKIMYLVPNIFYSDSIFSNLYSNKINKYNKLPTQNQLNYYFNIIEIIVLKMYWSNKIKTNKKKYKVETLLLDKQYIDSIDNLKNQLKLILNLTNM